MKTRKGQWPRALHDDESVNDNYHENEVGKNLPQDTNTTASEPANRLFSHGLDLLSMEKTARST